MSTQPRPWVPFSFGGRAPAPAPPPTRSPPPPPPPRPSIPIRPTLPQQPPPPPTAHVTSPQPSRTAIPTRPFVPPSALAPAKSPQMPPVPKQILSSNKSPPHQIQTKPAASTEPPTTVKAPTPPSSPKVIKPSERAPPESPKLKLLDKTPKINRGRNDGASPTDKGMIKKLSHSEDKLGSSVITLAGENKGALMEVKPWVQHGKQAMSVSGEEGKSRDKSKSKGGIMAGYFNSNVQGLNNSIVCNGSIIYNDPGIHISVTRKPSLH